MPKKKWWLLSNAQKRSFHANWLKDLVVVPLLYLIILTTLMPHVSKLVRWLGMVW